jgi:hypothetical protein
VTNTFNDAPLEQVETLLPQNRAAQSGMTANTTTDEGGSQDAKDAVVAYFGHVPGHNSSLGCRAGQEGGREAGP